MVSNISTTPVLEEVFAKIGFGKFHVFVIILFGFIQFFYAVETVLLSFLGPILICSWKITLLESSVITMAVFFGMSTGSLIFGKLSDVYGRKIIVITSACGLFYFSVLCAGSPNVIWVVITRGLIGLFIGGFSTMFYTYMTEVMTSKQRGTSVICVQLFWSMGSYYISIMTLIIVPEYGWRLWLVITVTPMSLIIFFSLWLPESPRYLLLKNQTRDALKVLNQIASMNKSDYVSSVKNPEYRVSSWKDIFHKSYFLSTLICMYICFVSGISFYGIVFSSSVVNNIPHKCLQNMKTYLNPSIYLNSTTDNSCCFPQSWHTMKTVIISITGELVSYVIGMFVIKYIKRKLFLQILLMINVSVFFLMNLCLSPAQNGIIMMFGRGSGGTILRVNLLYISEVFPTNIRSFAIGMGNCFVRLGAMFSSFVVNLLMIQHSFLTGTMFYCTINLLALILVFFLPYETKDRPLPQNVEDDVSNLDKPMKHY